jgi:hypothetical protein
MREPEERVYTLEIGGIPVLTFRARNHREAQSILKEEWLLADLRAIRSNGVPVWDGKAKLSVRNADATEASRYERESKHQPIPDDLPIVYLVELY